LKDEYDLGLFLALRFFRVHPSSFILRTEDDRFRLLPEMKQPKALRGWLLGSLDVVFGLGRSDNVRKLTRRVNRSLPDSTRLRQDIAAIRQELLNSYPQKRFSEMP
jgi:hypothetical protein